MKFIARDKDNLTFSANRLELEIIALVIESTVNDDPYRYTDDDDEIRGDVAKNYRQILKTTGDEIEFTIPRNYFWLTMMCATAQAMHAIEKREPEIYKNLLRLDMTQEKLSAMGNELRALENKLFPMPEIKTVDYNKR